MILGGKRAAHFGQRSGYAGKRHFSRNGKSKEGCKNAAGQVPLMAQSIL
jgi:hypothetical protein